MSTGSCQWRPTRWPLLSSPLPDCDISDTKNIVIRGWEQVYATEILKGRWSVKEKIRLPPKIGTSKGEARVPQAPGLNDRLTVRPKNGLGEHKRCLAHEAAGSLRPHERPQAAPVLSSRQVGGSPPASCLLVKQTGEQRINIGPRKCFRRLRPCSARTGFKRNRPAYR